MAAQLIFSVFDQKRFMPKFNLAFIRLMITTLSVATVTTTLAAEIQVVEKAAPLAITQGDTLRPEISRLISSTGVKDLIASKNYGELQSRLDQVAAMPDLTSYENYVLNRILVVLGSVSGNNVMAMTSLPVVIESGHLTPTEKADFIQALASYFYNAKDYSNANLWFTRYEKETGRNALRK